MKTTIDRYFEWICNLVESTQYGNYSRLLRHLHNREFYYSSRVPLDSNRLTDGLNLRYRFGYEKHIPDATISRYLDKGPCSVLEMMASLALRCEETIMVDEDIGDRTGLWFWSMITSLGLIEMTDTRYDENYVDFVVTRFLNREYEPNGKGGLFTVNTQRDMRTVEIWCQLMWYLDKLT